MSEEVDAMASDHPPDDVRKSDPDTDLLLVDAEKVFHMHHQTTTTPKNNTGRVTSDTAAYELRQSLIQRNLAFLHEPHEHVVVVGGAGDEDTSGSGPMICDLRHESLNQILKQSIEIEKPSKFASGAGDEDDMNNNHRDLLLGELDHHNQSHQQQHQHQQHNHQHLHHHQHNQQVHHGSGDGSDRDRVAAGIKQSVDDRFAELMGDESDMNGEKVYDCEMFSLIWIHLYICPLDEQLNFDNSS